MAENALSALIDEHSVISFDVFDTLIKRNVSDAADLFRIIEMNYFRQYGKKIDFAAKRKQAEKTARKTGPFYEVNLDEIYQQLLIYYDKNTVQKLKDMEIKAEINFAMPNAEVFNIFEECKRKAKRIFIASDMYLSKEIIEKMLLKCGYTGYQKLYVSCELRKTKWENGLLYKAIAEENQIKCSDILHIGNDRMADFVMAKRQGLDAFLINQKANNCQYYNNTAVQNDEKLQYDCIEKFIDNNFAGINKPNSYKLGFEVFGPLLYGCCDWLVEEVRSHKIEKVYFFSRDGYVLKKGFELLNSDIETHYFLASRRSVIASLYSSDITLEQMISHYKSWPRVFDLKLLFGRFCLDIKDFDPIISKYGFCRTSQFTCTKLLKDDNIKLLFEDIKPYISKSSQCAFSLLKEYTEQEKMFGRIAMIDIGAGCSIETAFREFIKKAGLPIDLWALNVQSYKQETNRRKNYIDTSIHEKDIYSVWRFCYILLEVFLTAPHGTVLGYNRAADGRVRAVLEDYKYNNKDGKANESALIWNLQQGALDFVRKYSKELSADIPISSNLAFANFKNLGLAPRSKDLTELGNFRLDGDKFEPLVGCRKLRTYMFDPLLFIRDFQNSMWPAGFLMKCFKSRKINMCVYKLYKYCRCH